MERHILHIHDQALPPTPTSGGSNRLVDWLAKEQSLLGHMVSALSPQGHTTPYYQHILADIKQLDFQQLCQLIPDSVTDIEYHGGLTAEIAHQLCQRYPRFISVIHSTCGKTSPNRVYVSASHARHHDDQRFIYNGVPVDEIEFSEDKKDYALFLAKVKRSKKGVQDAIDIAKQTKHPLLIAGGRRFGSPETWFPWHPSIKPLGYINGAQKQTIIKHAKALWVPIRWEEPFGLTVVEAMLAGTPVIAYNRGAMKELIHHGVSGFVCDTKAEFIDALNLVDKLDPKIIRQHALDNFSALKMATAHLDMLTLAGSEPW
ncbi:glycosyltransferase [Motilimonas eburnea]|uniref:glycosyltransferase n=1 Tax=Motilimonas eburnea TaxID=1737488 RepID=UPI001E577763|nr:glycosyltransferase [Motilimonas eburnea]MCE2572627.1 glycosyltransferase [Motilimonas eburnea]